MQDCPMFFPEKKTLSTIFFSPQLAYIWRNLKRCVLIGNPAHYYSVTGVVKIMAVCAVQKLNWKEIVTITPIWLWMWKVTKKKEDEKQKVNYIHILDTISACKNLVFGKQLNISNNKSAILLDFMAYIHFWFCLIF